MDAELAAEILRDPVPAGRRRNSHLYGVARPHDPFTLRSGEVDAAVKATSRRVPRGHDVFPAWRHLTHCEDRNGGVGYSAPGLVRRQMVPGTEESNLLDIGGHRRRDRDFIL